MSITSDNLSADPARCYDSPLVNLFTGQLHGRTECASCSYVSHRFDPFWSLDLPVSGSVSDLNQLLTNFTKVEKLGETEQVECDRCKGKSRALRRTTLWRLPQVLIISLKRAQGSHQHSSRFSSSKASTSVNINSTLELRSYLSVERQNTKYELYATANHYGSRTHFGHCTCSILKDGKWYEIDDMTIMPLEAPDPRSVCILFYRRV